MDNRTEIAQFWQSFARSHLEALERGHFEAFVFGSSAASASRLAALAMRGVKTATSDLLWRLQDERRPIVQEGDYSIVTNWEGQPLCIIRTIEVRIMPFNEVDAAFVYDYGEGERTLDWWHNAIWNYYAQECTALGREPTPNMPIICERFQVVYPPHPTGDTQEQP